MRIFIPFLFMLFSCNNNNNLFDYYFQDTISTNYNNFIVDENLQLTKVNDLNYMIVERNDTIINFFINNQLEKGHIRSIRICKLVNYINSVIQYKDTIFSDASITTNELFSLGERDIDTIKLSISEKEFLYSSGGSFDCQYLNSKYGLSYKDYYTPFELLLIFQSLYTGKLPQRNEYIYDDNQLHRISNTLNNRLLFRKIDSIKNLYYIRGDEDVVLLGKHKEFFFVSGYRYLDYSEKDFKDDLIKKYEVILSMLE